MCNANRMEVKVITWGATIVSIKCPDKYGDTADVVLGFDDLESYLDPSLNSYIGCILGRCANRIMDGSFKIKDTDYFLTRNEMDRHHLHGGVREQKEISSAHIDPHFDSVALNFHSKPIFAAKKNEHFLSSSSKQQLINCQTNGFGRRIWESHLEDGCSVIMSYLSADGDEGYPGAVLVTAKFKLTDDNRLTIGIRASTSKPTLVNLSHGSLFNLAGHDAGEEELRSHKITLNCDRWTVSEFEDPVPTGAIRGVGGTTMDLRIAKTIGESVDKATLGKGFDHNFCVLRNSQPEVSFVARALHPKTGRFLEIYSDQPGVQFYTASRLPPYTPATIFPCDDQVVDCADPCDCETESSNAESHVSEKNKLQFLPGKAGAEYKRFCAFGLQPQNYPNAVNVAKFPCPILRPGQVYYHDLIYKFGVQLCDSL
ncbi:aldose 1-epimerase-like isoform X3 [Nasonia vitripennis]|nr:aldose 1-epimerase-like isoform X3 [Nasonia vitripennis]